MTDVRVGSSTLGTSRRPRWIRAVKWLLVALLAARFLYLFVSWLRSALA